LEDYYAILGLDPGASQQSIKLAYRRLARESHPDRNINSSESQKAVLSLQMANLNGAYAVLSDATLRREYDEKLRIMGTLSSNTVTRATPTVSVTKSVSTTQTTSKSHSGFRVKTSPDVDASLVRELSKKVRSNLLANRKGFSWKETSLEGFDWGLECVSWTAHYCVAGRGFAVLDPAAAKKFANYSEVVISRFTRSVRKSHFLFVLPFQHLSQWDSVSAELNRIFTSDDGQKKYHVPGCVVLFDSRKGRTLRVGSQLKDKQFEDVLLCLGPEVINSREVVSQ
jgi:curved DNA-binding protein CbpA